MAQTRRQVDGPDDLLLLQDPSFINNLLISTVMSTMLGAGDVIVNWSICLMEI